MGGMITAGRIASLIEEAPVWALIGIAAPGKACGVLPDSKSRSMFIAVYFALWTPKRRRSLCLGNLWVTRV